MQNFFFDYLAKPLIAALVVIALCGFLYVGYMLATPIPRNSGANSADILDTPTRTEPQTGGGIAQSAQTTASSPTTSPTPAQNNTTPGTQQTAPPRPPQPTQAPMQPKPTQIPPQPTQAPTATPTPQPDPSPYIQPGVNGNPWGYDFHPGSIITQPPAQFCQYFNCIASFWQGSGYVVECQDGMYSLSGGRPGSCSWHGGDAQILYQHH